jgi:23S rRNA (uracil1939-C5)-methyltransferase
VFGVESDPENITFLKRNIGMNHVGNFSVCEGTSEGWAEELLDKRLDVILLDPPRKGVDERVCQALLARPAKLVLYLSCNPATLARDLKRLLRIYRLRTIRGFDFFPHTPHIETLAVLDRAKQRDL